MQNVIMIKNYKIKNVNIVKINVIMRLYKEYKK